RERHDNGNGTRGIGLRLRVLDERERRGDYHCSEELADVTRPAAKEAAREYERSLPLACQTLVSPEQAAQGTAHHRLAVTAQVFFVHCRFVRLSRFRFHRDLRP